MRSKKIRSTRVKRTNQIRVNRRTKKRTKKRTKRTKKQTKKRINKIKKRVKKTNQIIQKGGVVTPCVGLTDGGVIAAWTRGATDLTGNNCKNLYYHPEDLWGVGRIGAWYVGNSRTKATFPGSEGTNTEPYQCPQCAHYNDLGEINLDQSLRVDQKKDFRKQQLENGAWLEELVSQSVDTAVSLVKSGIFQNNELLKHLKPTDIKPVVMKKLVSLSVTTDGERNVLFALGATEIIENLLLGGEGGQDNMDIVNVLLVVVNSMYSANLYDKNDILGSGFDEWYDGVNPT